jgi:hypothetical protein
MFRAVTELTQNRSWNGMDQKLKESYRRLFFYNVFIHELCHAWVEDLVSKVCIKNDVDIKDSPYTTTLKKYKAYIPMEEALCNTAAYGYLYNLKIVDNSCDEIKEEIFSWMRGQPKGYRNFKEIKEEPGKSKQFQKLVCLVLKTCYGLNLPNIDQPVKEYFEKEDYKKIKVPLDFIPQFIPKSKSKFDKFMPEDFGNPTIDEVIKKDFKKIQDKIDRDAYKGTELEDLLNL